MNTLPVIKGVKIASTRLWNKTLKLNKPQAGTQKPITTQKGFYEAKAPRMFAAKEETRERRDIVTFAFLSTLLKEIGRERGGESRGGKE